MPKKKTTKTTKPRTGLEDKSAYPQLSTAEENKVDNTKTNLPTNNQRGNISHNDPKNLLGVDEPEDSIYRPLVFQSEEESK